MPIYDYMCAQCKRVFEYFHVTKDEKAQCPHCASEDVVKQVSKSEFVLKGPGWAKDRYGK